MSIVSAAASTAQLAASYASLILADDGVEITADKLQSLIKKADVNVEPVVPNLFAKVLEGKDPKTVVEELNKTSDKNGGDVKGLNGNALSDKRVAAMELLKLGGNEEPTQEEMEDLIRKHKFRGRV